MSTNNNQNEISFTIDKFNEVHEYTGKYAWAQQLMSLILLTPGTYPSLPKMGVGLGQYEYTDLDDFKRTICDKIKSQANTYLPGIPLDTVELIDKTFKGRTYVLILITFTTSEGSERVVVATQQTGNIIDFKVTI